MCVCVLCAGPIPRDLGHLARLTHLDLFQNRLTGRYDLAAVEPSRGRCGVGCWRCRCRYCIVSAVDALRGRELVGSSTPVCGFFGETDG